MSERVVIIAALEREIAPLVRRWRREGRTVERWTKTAYRIFRCGDVLAVAGGMGKQAAANAARFAIERWSPRLVISAGFAGGLRTNVLPGSVVLATSVVDAETGRTFESTVGDERKSPLNQKKVEWATEGVLVTAASVLSRDEKTGLAGRFGADAVDMEAAAVAEAAGASGIGFCAVKGISDALEFDMPPMHRFMNSAGRLNMVELLAFATPRPAIWRALWTLQRNTSAASAALAEVLGTVCNPLAQDGGVEKQTNLAQQGN